MAFPNAKPFGTPVDVSARGGRRTGPTEKRGGIALQTEVWAGIDEIVALTNEAYAELGGTSKVSTSDELDAGAQLRIAEFIKDHGALPETKDERREYVKRLATSLRADLRAFIRAVPGK